MKRVGLGYKLGVGRYFGIPVYFHWSFVLTLLLIGYVWKSEQLNLSEGLIFTLFYFSIFLCIVLHEYGHALTARRFGIGTRDILLTPIGGVARLEGMPLVPKGELLIALAGPAVNLIIAGIIFIGSRLIGITSLTPDTIDVIEIIKHPVGFMYYLFWMNVILVGFNLIPAFPMDGGRVLRALLSYKLDRVKATFIAHLVGRAFAIGFIIFAAFNKLPGIFGIGVFIYIMAGREYQYVIWSKREEEAKNQNWYEREETNNTKDSEPVS